MVSRLVPRSPQLRAQRRQRVEQIEQRIQTIRAESPWQLYTPDLDPGKLGANAAGYIEGLIARPDPATSGEVLTHTDGFALVDSTRLPGVLGAGAGSVDANSNLSVTGMGFFPRTDSGGDRSSDDDFTVMMMTAGDATNPGSAQLWRIRPSNGQWQEVTFAGSGTAAQGDLPASDNPDRVLMEWAVSPAGSGNRTAGAIAVPAFVFTNNEDEVYIYPDATAGTNYETLTTDAGLATFLARSVALFNSRIYYLNTSENGTRFRQRLRRPAIGEADPTTTLEGVGANDLRQFSEDGLKILPIGEQLAIYFGDGVAFLQATGNPVAPDQIRTLTTQRGLLSTHSVTAIDANTHFGIFTDGWWLIDSSGRFQEVGISEIGGIRVTKWKSTFYRLVDMNVRERIFVHYDQSRRLVFITFPITGATGDDPNTQTWIWDPRGDRITIDPYHATCFTSVNQQISTAYTIAGGAPDLDTLVESGGGTTIGQLTGTIGSYASRFGVKAIMHGTHNGLVMQHDPSLTTKVNILSQMAEEPTYRYRTVLSNLGSARIHKLGQRILVEHIKRSGSATMSAQFFCNASQTAEEYALDLSPGSTGDTTLVWEWFRFSSPEIGFEVSGTGPVAIGSIEADLSLEESELRRDES